MAVNPPNDTLQSAEADYQAGRYEHAFRTYRAIYARSELSADLVRRMAASKLASVDTLGPGEGASDADWGIVVEACDRLVSRGMGDGMSARECGRAYLMHGDAELAAKALSAASQALPNDAEAHSALAAALGSMSRTDDAIRHARRATELQPGSASAQGNLGALLMLSNSPKNEALAAFERALALEPKVARRYSDVASAKVLLGDNAGAVAAYRKAIELEPNRANFHASLGYALLVSGDVAGAQAACEKATTLDPKSIPGWVNLAVVYARSKRPVQAREALSRAEAIDPQDMRVRTLRDELAPPKK